jgi:hypothetical protein
MHVILGVLFVAMVIAMGANSKVAFGIIYVVLFVLAAVAYIFSVK